MFSGRFANDSCLITGILCFYGKQSATGEREREGGREWRSIEVDQERGSGARGNRPERDLLKHQHIDHWNAHRRYLPRSSFAIFFRNVQLLFISSVETHSRLSGN